MAGNCSRRCKARLVCCTSCQTFASQRMELSSPPCFTGLPFQAGWRQWPLWAPVTARKVSDVRNMHWNHGWNHGRRGLLVAAGLSGLIVGLHGQVTAAGAEPVSAGAANKADDAAGSSSSGTAGRYSILRDGGKDTGCMLTLAAQAKERGSAKVSLAPGCRDQGIVIFDPVAWQIAGGRLVLTARKGHKTHLDAQPDGTWKKDPKEGKALILKKL